MKANTIYSLFHIHLHLPHVEDHIYLPVKMQINFYIVARVEYNDIVKYLLGSSSMYFR